MTTDHRRDDPAIAGLLERLYAVISFEEGNLESARPNGVHNEINTRAELQDYDPGLYTILAEVLPDAPGYRDCYYYE